MSHEPWDLARVGDLLAGPPKNGYSPKQVDEWTGTQMLGLGCLTADGFTPSQLKNAPRSDSSLERALLADGDLLMSRSNTRDRVGYAGRYCDVGTPCIYPDLMMRLRASSAVLPSYLERVLQSPRVRRQVEAAAVGTSGSMVKINRRVVERLETPLPPLPEQRRIAEILDTLDAAIRKTAEVIAKLEQVKQGLLHDLLTRGIDENGELRDPERHPEQFKDSPLGRIPREWEVVETGELLAGLIDFRGRTPLKLGMSWGGGDIPALSARNVRQGHIDLKQETYYGSDALYDRWMTTGDPAAGDVLITLEAPLGNVAQIPDASRYILSQRVVLLKFDPQRVEHDFMATQMRAAQFQANLRRWSTGTTATGIQRAKLVKIPLAVPHLDEQTEIAAQVGALRTRIEAGDTELVKLRDLKRGMLDDLLTGRVRVNIGEAAE